MLELGVGGEGSEVFEGPARKVRGWHRIAVTEHRRERLTQRLGHQPTFEQLEALAELAELAELR